MTVLCSGSMITLAQDASNTSFPATSENKIVIGAGVSYNLGLGGHLKYDYLLTNKFSIGLKSMMTSYGFEDFTNTDAQLKADYKPGNVLGVMIATTFYIFGKNNSESKGGMYASLGLGYSASKFSKTVTSLTPVDSLYYKYNNDFRSKNFSGLISIGGDSKLGPGRIYFEIPLTLDIYGTVFDKYTFQISSPYVLQPDNTKYTRFQGFSTMLFLNLGYQLYF
jgi:hypothetical protein